MEHVLDNPAWNALITGNSHLSEGTGDIRYFQKEVSPFAGFKQNTPDNFSKLYDLVQPGRMMLFVTTVPINIPEPWKVLQCVPGLQMVYNKEKAPDEPRQEMTTLTTTHIPQMIALTQLTSPGPFDSRTIEFGHYQGVFEDEKLVAMAGQRMQFFNYAEISAVCTHPDYTGRGYARQLLLNQIHRIKAASMIPFLHVRDNNERAIKVYESLGFAARTAVYFYVMQK